MWPLHWNLAQAPFLRNGWGAVVFHRDRNQQPWCIPGQIPTELLVLFAQKKAYIFLLESIAQIIPAFLFGDVLRGKFACFIDNEAARFALTKGFSSDEVVNSLAGAFWAWAAKQGTYPWFERVSSAANAADALSRFDYSVAERLSWKHWEFDCAPIYHLLAAWLSAHKFDASALVTDIWNYVVSERTRVGWELMDTGRTELAAA